MTNLEQFSKHRITCKVYPRSKVLTNGEEEKGQIIDGEFLPYNSEYPDTFEHDFYVFPINRRSMTFYPDGTRPEQTRVFYDYSPSVASNGDTLEFDDRKFKIVSTLDLQREEGILKYYGMEEND